MFKTVEKYYKLGHYDDEDVKVFVQAKYITEEEYKKITGKDFEL